MNIQQKDYTGKENKIKCELDGTTEGMKDNGRMWKENGIFKHKNGFVHLPVSYTNIDNAPNYPGVPFPHLRNLGHILHSWQPCYWCCMHSVLPAVTPLIFIQEVA